MDTKKIRVRREVVRCDMCKQPKEFIYLSDFAYGQRLIYLKNEIDFAFINLLEDDIFLEYDALVKDIVKKNNIVCSTEEINDFIIKSFGLACDDIKGMKIDFSIEQKRCLFCGSTKFERNMIEPENIIETELPVVSHEEWKMLEYNQKESIILDELKKEGIVE